MGRWHAMTLTLELMPEQERHKGAEARHHNLAAVSGAKALLFDERETGRGDEAVEEQWSGADLVADWEQEGVIGSRPNIKDSLEHARAIRQKAERRDRK